MLKIGICDDNISEINRIEDLLNQYFYSDDAQNICIDIRKYTSGKELLEDNRELDVLFLDIELEQENGFDIAQKYQDEYLNTIIVIISSHTEYISESFHYVNVFQFLCKPIEQDLFVREMKRVLEKYHFQNDFYILEDQIGNTIAIKFKDIIYMKSDKNMIQLCSRLSEDKQTFRASFYREAWKLEKYDFIRCHRQYIINLKYVESIDDKSVILCAGNKKIKVPIGKNRYHIINTKIREFKARYICSNFML